MNKNTIKWEQQIFPNSCVLCVLTMLLSTQGFDVTVREIAEKCRMTELMEYLPEEDIYQIGFLAFQTADNYNRFLLDSGYCLVESKTTQSSDYLGKIDDLLTQGHAIMVGLPQYLLPYSDPDMTSMGKHAVLLTGEIDNCFMFWDSDGGLDRRQRYETSLVLDSIHYGINRKDFVNALKNSEAFGLNLAYLDVMDADCSTKDDLCYYKLSDQNRELFFHRAIPELYQLFDNMMVEYSSFHAWTYKFIKPLVTDLYSVLQCLDDQSDLSVCLSDLKKTVFDDLRKMKTGEPLDYTVMLESYRYLVNKIQKLWSQQKKD